MAAIMTNGIQSFNGVPQLLSQIPLGKTQTNNTTMITLYCFELVVSNTLLRQCTHMQKTVQIQQAV